MFKLLLISIPLAVLFILIFTNYIPATYHVMFTPKKVLNEIGTPNLITAIYLDYRAYDTLFEILVYSIAILGVRVFLEDIPVSESVKISGTDAARTLSVIIAPLISTLGFYFLLTGTVEPGGAFPGGIIMAIGLLLIAIFYGPDKVMSMFTKYKMDLVEKFVLNLFVLYALLGIFKGNYFNNLITVKEGIYVGGGIIFLNVLVGIKVFAGSYNIMYFFIKHRGTL
jgi:multicomponent Na+:H+ antiporter subunit B